MAKLNLAAEEVNMSIYVMGNHQQYCESLGLQLFFCIDAADFWSVIQVLIQMAAIKLQLEELKIEKQLESDNVNELTSRLAEVTEYHLANNLIYGLFFEEE